MAIEKEALKILQWYKDPVLFFNDTAGTLPDVKEMGGKPSTDQEVFLKDLPDWDISRMIVCSAGGCGKTLTFADAALWHMVPAAIVLDRPIKVSFLSGSKPQATIMYEHFQKLLYSHPIIEERILGEPIQSKTKFKDGSRVLALARSWTSILGEHSNVVFVDEAVLAGDDVIKDTRRIVSGQRPNRVCLGSTPQEYMSLFVTMIENTKDGDKYENWKPYWWSKKNCHWVTPEEIMEAKKEFGENSDYYRIWWEGLPTPLVGTLVSHDDLKKASEGKPRFKYVDPEENPRAETPIAGVDWGWRNPSALTIRQKVGEKFRVLFNEVFQGKTGLDFEKIHDWIETHCRSYHVQVIFTDCEDVGENQRLANRGFARIIPVALGKEGIILKSRMKALFQQGMIEIPDDMVAFKHQLSVYTWTTSENDDRAVSFILSLKDPRRHRGKYKLQWRTGKFKLREKVTLT